jgi:PAS domain S-box-containing protein
MTELQRQFQALMDAMSQGAFLQNADGSLCDVNPAALELFGLDRDEFLGRTSYAAEWHVITDDGQPLPPAEHPSMQALATGKPVRNVVAGVFNSQRHRYVWMEINAIPLFREGEARPHQVFVTLHDITEQKRLTDINRVRLHLIEFSATHTIEELLVETLDKLEELTGSSIGFYHFYDAEQRCVTLKEWSTRTTKEFCHAEGKDGHYCIDQAGVWVDCIHQKKPVIHNDYLSLPHRRGLPKGHAPVGRELVVPVIRNGRIVAILGIGNKPADYDQHDVELVSLLADLAWGVVEHKRYEDMHRYQNEITKNMSEGIILTRVDNGLIVLTNPKFDQMFGYGSGELIGKDVATINAPNERTPKETSNFIREILANAGEWHGEIENLKKDGTHFWCYASVSKFDSLDYGAVYISVHTDITERKHAEAANQQTHAKFISLTSNVPGYVALVDAKTLQYQFVNDEYAISFGLPKEKIIGSHVKDIVGETVYQFALPHITKVLSGQSDYYEKEFQLVTGKRWLRVNYNPVFDSNDQVTAITVLSYDITELRQAMEELQKREARLSFLLSATPAVIYSCYYRDYFGAYFVSENVFALTGYRANEFVEDPSFWSTHIHPDDSQRVLSELDNLRTKGSHAHEYRFLHQDGTYRWMHDENKLLYDTEGNPTEIIGFWLDVTERKQAEVALRKSENLFRTLAQNAPVGIFQSDAASNCIYVNRKWCELSGLSEEEAMGAGWAKTIHPDDLERVMAEWQECVQTNRYEELEFRFTTPSGKTNWVSNIVTPLYSVSGELYGYIGCVTDITERIQQEKERLFIERQLQQTQRLESLGVLAGGIAHDFNNILAVIMGNCSLAEMDYEKAGDYIPMILQASERAAGLCRQMLAYAGKSQFVQANVNFGAQVADAVKMLQSTLPQNVAIKFEGSPDIPEIKADASQITQVAMNLVINASEAIGEAQGEIRVAISTYLIKDGQTEKDYLGKIIPSGWYVCLEVSDNGCGMSAETYNRIFEPFYSTKFAGRGLGMSAVLGIVTSHGGALQLLSQPGQGTTFKIFLPLQINHAAASGHLPQKDSSSSKMTGTVLLVEDEKQVLMIAKSMLKTLGFTVIEAVNGKDALALYQNKSSEITLVLTDIGMPIMNGYELIRELKKLNPELPIIISSGFGDIDISSKVSHKDVAGLIGKPYNFNQMREVINSVIDGD